MDLYLVPKTSCDIKPYDKLRKCTADYRGQCSGAYPYICTRGLVKGGCTANPNIWQESRMCKEFCDVRNEPDVVIKQPPKMYLGLRNPQIEPGFIGYEPAKNRSKQVHCPIPMTQSLVVKYPPTDDKTFMATGQKMCPNHMPYQCLAGSAFGGCSEHKQVWENSEQCYSYCDTRNPDTLDYYFQTDIVDGRFIATQEKKIN